MIKRIELWDFESHEHTVIDDLSPALSLFCGESNAGKTSIVRALKLVAYNDFDTKSIRIGAKKCVVLVETERGTVKVTRGPKDNLWETTRVGQKTQYFDKVGVNIVPEAAEIIGLNIVTLGDVSVPVNIMDQLESHFLLAGVGDKDATGSMRAQIVDEISGLSGIEGLIKDVGLDHHRFGRELTETEKKMEEIRKQLHPAADLKAEGQTLEKAEKEFEKHKDCEQIAAEGNNLYLKWNLVDQQISTLLWNESKIPDTDAALLEIARADGLLVRADSAEKLYRDGTAAAGRLSAIDKALAGIPDTHAAAVCLDASGAALVVFESATALFKKWDEANKAIEAKEKREKELEAYLKAEDEIQTAQDLMAFCTLAETLLQAHQKVVANIAVVDQQLAEKDKALKDAEKERDEILASVTTCPLTLRPVSKECLV